MSDDITDMTRGVYRRQYAGFATGKRINAVTLAAEAWFWRVHSIAADDFGNCHGDDQLVFAATVGRRQDVSVQDCAGWLREMADQDLIRFYEVAGERFLHVVDFLRRQPKAKNGRRVKRVPHSPWDGQEEPGCVPVNPRESGRSHSHSQTHSQPQKAPAAQGSAATAAAAAAAAAAPDPILTFPTVAGKREKATTWDFTPDHLAELSETFPDVDVRAEARKALAWVKAKSGNRKTAGGMREFLFRWMSRANDRGGGHKANGNAGRVSSMDRQQQVIEAAFADAEV